MCPLSARHHSSCSIQEYEKVVIFRLGRILGGGERGPGIFFILPCTDKFEIIDMRVQNWSVPPQEMITRSEGYYEKCQQCDCLETV